MTIGKFDRRIQIYGTTSTVDAYGQPVTARALMHTVWAKMEPLEGSEGTDGDKVTATGRVKFSIRYRTGLNEAREILFDEEYYDVVSIEKPDRKRILEITGEKKY